MKRFDHLKQSKARKKVINEKVGFRHWMKHPFANTKWFLQSSLPHKPKKEYHVAMVGPIDFVGLKDCEWMFVSLVCKRCLFEFDSVDAVPVKEN